MKKVSRIILFICLIGLIFTNICWAKDKQGIIDVYNVKDYLNFYLNGEEFRGSYFIENGTTYMKLKDLEDILGIELKWDKSTKGVSFFVKDKKVNLWVNKTTANIGNNKVKLSFAPCIVQGRTYLPLRFVSELLGFKVNYIDIRKNVEFFKEIILEHLPELRQTLEKGRHKFNEDTYTQYFFIARGYDPKDNILIFQVFEIVEHPEESHEVTLNWFYVDLDTCEITDFFGEVLQ